MCGWETQLKTKKERMAVPTAEVYHVVLSWAEEVKRHRHAFRCARECFNDIDQNSHNARFCSVERLNLLCVHFLWLFMTFNFNFLFAWFISVFVVHFEPEDFLNANSDLNFRKYEEIVARRYNRRGTGPGFTSLTLIKFRFDLIVSL